MPVQLSFKFKIDNPTTDQKFKQIASNFAIISNISVMMTPADRAAAIMKDARFKQARKCLKEKNYEDSIEIFSSLVQSWYVILLIISFLFHIY